MSSAIKELSHLQIPLQDILHATKNFSDKNVTGQGDFGKVYRGKIKHKGKMVKIAARRLDRKHGLGDVEFWNEVSSLSGLKGGHAVVHMIGYCDEKGEKIIVIDHRYVKGSLSRYISDPLTLNVYMRLRIAERVCWGVNYIHRIINLDGEFKSDYIIHRNINSFTILLDAQYEPSLSGFEYSIKHSREQRDKVVSLNSKMIGTKGYIDPAIEKYGGVNYKSDIYSIGVVLFELLCGRKAFDENVSLAPLAKFHYENGTLKDITHLHIWNQMRPESFKQFSKVAYSCLQEDPALRPNAQELLRQIEKARRMEYKRPEERPIFENLLLISSPNLWKRWWCSTTLLVVAISRLDVFVYFLASTFSPGLPLCVSLCVAAFGGPPFADAWLLCGS
ncbi:probable receptor-like protein kinase At5g59700 [Rutidosis leptorrhynchoides]|uniref:probable receptor-like protein kinase At5g59700 n=1 Tax=Rutidosis leptorrhynchoides TaxID=125765 RepID=UPI003A9A4E6B